MPYSPDLYAEVNKLSPATVKKHLTAFNSHITWKNDEFILEIGIGDGKTTEKGLYPFLPKDYKEFLLTDNSEKCLNYVKQRLNLPRSKFEQLDITSQHLNTDYINKFDHIFAFYVLHALKDPRQAIKNIYKMLKPGGQAVMTCFEQPPLDDVYEKISKHPKWGKFGTQNSAYYYTGNPEYQYKKDLREAGFQDFLFEVDKNMKFQLEGEEWKKLYVAVNEVIGNVPEDQREEYIKYLLEVTQESEKLEFTEVDGKRVSIFHFNMFIIIATKTV